MTSDGRLAFGLLGPVEVRLGSRELPVGGRLQRALLADLILNVGRVVPKAQLIDDLWGQAPPPSAAHIVETHVSRLRRVLHLEAGDEVLRTQASGYLLDVDPAAVDVNRFEALVTQADDTRKRREVDSACRLLTDALALVRGEPLCDIADVPFAAVAVRRMNELRLTATERRLDAQLALGQHREAVTELQSMTDRYPYRESLYAQLMVGLYRSGRQTEALAAFRHVRSVLADELGIEPGPELRRLEHAVLNHDPSIELPRSGGAPGLRSGPSSSVTESRPRRRRPRRSRLIPAAIVVIAATSVTTAALLTADRGSSGTTWPTNGIGVLTASGRSAAVGFALPTAPGDLVGGAGSVWLTSPEGQVVYRLDAHSHRVVQTISVGSGPEGLAYANGAVWVANALDGTVTRIDAATNRAVQTLSVGGEPTGVAFAYGSVWVTDPLSSTVIKIDPTSGRLIKSIGVPSPPLGITFGAGSMWVTSEPDDSVTRINPLSGVVELRIGVGGGPDAISFGFGSAWVANRLDSTVSRIDPNNNAVDRTIPVGEGPSSVVIAPTAVWVAGGVSGSVSKIDPGRDVVVATIPVGNRPGAGVFVGGRLWVTLRPAAARGHRGGTLQLLSSAPFATIDPATSYPQVPPLFDASIFDTLVTFQRVGGTEGGRLVPDLALAIPTPKNSGRTYTFELRPGLRYSTGERVHPKDFRHGLERVFALNPAARSFFTDLLGASNCSSATPCDLSRAVVVDDARDTVEFHLSTADSNFLDKLAFAFTAPVPGSVPSLDRGATPVPSTGPYKITHFAPGRKIEIARNPYFREWSRAAQPDGYPDAMVWSFGRAIGDEVSAIETGHADWTVDNPPDVAAVEAQYAGQVHINPLPGIAYAAFNVTVPPFNDERVRHAVSLAADRNAAVQALGGIDSAQPTCQILPPHLAGYRPYCPFTVNSGSGKWVGPDVAQAARLITQSHTSGMRVVVWGHHGDDALGKFFVSLLNSLGYRATLHLSDDADVAANINDSRKRVQASIGEWIADYPSASNFFDLFFRCSAFRLGDPNDTRSSLFYCRPKIDQLMNEADASKMSDPSASAATWAYVDRLVTDDAAWVPFASLRFADLISARARNYEYSPVWGLLVDQLWIR